MSELTRAEFLEACGALPMLPDYCSRCNEAESGGGCVCEPEEIDA